MIEISVNGQVRQLNPVPGPPSLSNTQFGAA